MIAEQAAPARFLDDPAVVRGALASLALHAALLVAFVVWPKQPPLPEPFQESLPVEVVSEEAYTAATTASARVPAAAEPEIATPPPEPAMIRPSAMLSAAALSDPKSRAGKAVYDGLAPEEQMVQLCDLEAMEQVHAWNPALDPERIVAHTLAPVDITGTTVEADGATFRAGERWYTLKFACDLSPDGARVVAFAFHVGDEVPARDLERLNLIVGEDE